MDDCFSVSKEVKDELERLRKRVAELEDFASQKDKYDRELCELKRKLELQKSQVKEEARKMRLPEIMKALEAPAYIADWNYEFVLPKCDKCDENRKIHFKSPSGRDLDEDCSCAKRKSVYHPKQGIMIKFNWMKDREPFLSEEIEMRGVHFDYVSPESFIKTIENDNEEYTIEFSKFYHGQSFKDISCYDRLYFRNLEDCQAYCDYRNKQN